MIRILIVEDDPLMSRLYEKTFRANDFEVVLAHDGEDGLKKAQTMSPAIILLDVMMPKMNGMQVLETIKADPAIKMIPIIMLTNLGGQKDAEDAIAMGAVKYMLKSDNDPSKVVEAVKAIVGASSALQS